MGPQSGRRRSSAPQDRTLGHDSLGSERVVGLSPYLPSCCMMANVGFPQSGTRDRSVEKIDSGTDSRTLVVSKDIGQFGHFSRQLFPF
ncbi:hypothetical protein PhaeoP97_02093 [Phaeobacter porticola]|uniref:Uncharacterized protein n=1 Tax=Phaeobacter porticola TaxID=1844006 RepID=A0A1L3I5W3_9RHOB|nr:hypothetical protein PhaeoP97_02093 [Phaeobacter porticola]